jgi:hypothetical protein
MAVARDGACAAESLKRQHKPIHYTLLSSCGLPGSDTGRIAGAELILFNDHYSYVIYRVVYAVVFAVTGLMQSSYRS